MFYVQLLSVISCSVCSLCCCWKMVVTWLRAMLRVWNWILAHTRAIVNTKKKLRDRATRKPAKIILLKWTWKWQLRLKLPLNVLWGHQKWHQSKASVWVPTSTLYSNFCRICTVYEKFDVKQSNDLEISPRYHTPFSRITWKLSYGHVCKMIGRQWTIEAKIAIFNVHTLIWCPSPANPCDLHKPYTARNCVPWATFLPLKVYA